MTTEPSSDLRIAIIGAGAGGVCMGIQLREAGFENFVIFEKEKGLGGTWYHNRYPGCECDIPSCLYSYSFEPKDDWSRPYGSQSEILGYLEDCADKYGVTPHCRFGDGVRSATWDEAETKWTLELESGAVEVADVVVSAVGMFTELVYPEIEGLDTFEGPCFHSARWDPALDLKGRRVGVIGSAASAVQLVPEIANEVAHVAMFQRTANWVMPKANDLYTEEQLAHFRANPDVVTQMREDTFNGIDAGGAGNFGAIREAMEEACLGNIAVVEDPEVRAKLVPDHPWACKRPLLSSLYYPAFNRDNVELVTEGIECVTKNGVRTADGQEREFDVLVLATGFQATKFLSVIDVVGRSGRPLDEAWSDGAQAYKGVMTSGFPNLFMLYGPNTNGDSLITMIEFEVEFSVGKIRQLAEEKLAWIDVKPEAESAYNVDLQGDLANIEPWKAVCSDYYRSPSGRIVTQWPGRMTQLRGLLRTENREAYEVSK